MKLAGQARIYWRNLQATAERRHEPPITTWEEMKGRLRGKFVPACYRPMIIDEWQHLRQGDGTVGDYIARFDDLMIRCNIDEEPMATLARFRAGLRPEYQRELILQEVSTLEKAYRYTSNMELYSSHAQRTASPWYSAADTVRSLPPTHACTASFPLTELLKATPFEWSAPADRAFQQIKLALISAPALRLPDFDKLFDVATDASGSGIGAVLSQELHPISFFSEKLNEPKMRYSNYDRELYAVIQALKFWRHYLLHQEFTLYSDHEALRFLHSQKNLSARHGR